MYRFGAMNSPARALLALGAAAAAIAASAGPHADVATACSCGTPVLSGDLPKFDAAFVGIALSHRIDGSNAFWTFDVEQAVKGTLRTPLVIRAASSGSACGLELRDGDRTGLLLIYDKLERARYESGLCYQTDPKALARVALPGARVMGTGADGGWPWWPILVGVGAAVTFAFGLLSLRRRL
jgi:opacity protein-like surface antigen